MLAGFIVYYVESFYSYTGNPHLLILFFDPLGVLRTVSSLLFFNWLCVVVGSSILCGTLISIGEGVELIITNYLNIKIKKS